MKAFRTPGGEIENRQNRVLIVEDEAVARATLSAYFKKEGYLVSEARDGREMRRALDAEIVDLILLDIVLPGEDGLSLLRDTAYRSGTPVIMVSSKSDVTDRIVGLELGAADYVTKPFNMRELLARAKNVIRLSRSRPEPGAEEPVRCFNGWRLEEAARLLFDPEDREVPLTRAEFDMLAALTARQGRVMSRDALLQTASNREHAWSDRTVDVLIGRLRKKIEADPRNPRHIHTVHGIGYVFRAEPGATPRRA